MMNGSPDEPTLRRTGAAMAQRLGKVLNLNRQHRVLRLAVASHVSAASWLPRSGDEHGADIAPSIHHSPRTLHLPNTHFRDHRDRPCRLPMAVSIERH